MKSAGTTKAKPYTLKRPLIISAIGHIIVLILMIFAMESQRIEPPQKMDFVWVEIPKGVPAEFVEPRPEEEIPESERSFELPKGVPQKVAGQKAPEMKAEEEISTKKPEPDEKAMPEPAKKGEKKQAAKKTAGSSKINSALAKIDQRLKDRDVTKTPGIGSPDGTSTKAPTAIGSPDGTATNRSSAEYQGALIKYRANVRSKIIYQWRPPDGVKKEKMSIIVFISRSGSIISKRWGKKSSSEALNNSAMRAIDRASPFPIPPDVLKSEAFGEGFSVVFNP